jgi:hypothetical protein
MYNLIHMVKIILNYDTYSPTKNISLYGLLEEEIKKYIQNMQYLFYNVFQLKVLFLHHNILNNVYVW